MRKIAIITFAMLIASTAIGAKKTPVDYVNPLIGTALKGEGGTAPFVGTPFMMTNFLAQTRENKMSSMAYVHDDKSIIGFMASHQPTVWMGDYGYVSIMPQISDDVRTLPRDRQMSFSHDEESATPYLYKVRLHEQAPDGKVVAKTNKNRIIDAEMSAASRAGIMRFKFPKNTTQRIVVHGINLNPELGDWCNDFWPRINSIRGWVKVDTVNNEIVGYNPDRQSAQLGPELPNFKGYFVIKFNKPITNFGTWSSDSIFANKSESYGTRMGAYAEFGKGRQPLEVRVGTSFISLDQARENMEREIGGKSLEQVSANTRNEWEKRLAKLKVEGVDDDTKTIFYTAMYHCYLFPREFSEYGRYYSAFDDKIHEGVSYNDYSLWDTFRAFHPLMTFIEPEITNEWITSLLQMYQQGGWLPLWPNPTYTNIMIGTHADAVIADAYMKGIRGYDTALAYEAMRKNAMTPPDCDTQRRYGDRDRWTAYEARAGASYYHTIGYVPDDKTAESVSRTLEYAFDDWCIAQVAKDMGHNYDYEQLMRWSQNYRNVYYQPKGEMLPRNYDGSWHNLNDTEHHGMTEGSKWTYLFCVLHDVDGMIDMMGGAEKFAAKLDRNFNEGFYRHDNEPGHHYIYLYDWCGRPDRTQELARKHVRINYRNAPDGLNGNDDCGQMSAWYLFSAMGFYPVAPASNTFAIGAPQYPLIEMAVGDHTLRIVAENLSDENLYVDQITIDGRAHTSNFFTWEELTTAREIKFTMSSNAKRH